MKLLFSVPTGYHVRELIMPLRRHLEADGDISQIYVLTPVASDPSDVFTGYSDKFSFYTNPSTLEDHKTLIRELSPDIVITDTVGHDELDYPILKAASELKIRTLTFIASWDNVWKIGRLMESKKPIHVADSFIVWNTMMKEHLLRLFPAIQPSDIVVIGAPRLDYFWQKDRIPSKEAVYEYLGFKDLSKPLIHIATTELYPLDYVLKEIVKAVDTKAIAPAHIYASVHPGGNMENHRELTTLGATVKFSFGRKESAPHPNFAYRPTEEDIYMLIALFTHTAVLVNHSSSVALESMIAGTPIVNVKYGKPFDWITWYRSPVYRDFKEHYIDIISDGATYVAHNKKELIAAIQDAFAHPQKKMTAWKTTIERMITTTDGSAGQKVLSEIKQRSL